MTVIAWDGKTLASDRMATAGSYSKGTVTKIHRWKDGICGISGCMETGMRLITWLQDGADPEQFPMIEEEYSGEFLVIYNDGRVAYYERSATPLWFDNTFHAIGCGKDYALTAMHLGKTAEEAVAIASDLNIYCGNGIDTLELQCA